MAMRIERNGVDIRRLRYFVAVCDNGSVSRAASAVGIAQPALTRQIKLLEGELGVPLLTRSGRGAVPTDAGLFLLTEARKHLDGLDGLVDRLRTGFSSGPARVSLGICPTIVPLFLDHIGDALRQGPSAVELNVIEAYSGDLRNLMQAGRLDLALSYSPSPPSQLRITNLLSERLVLASQGVPDKSAISLADIDAMKLILPSRMHQLRRIIDTVCDERRHPLVPALELDSLTAVKALVGDGTGEYATILPYHSVAEDAAEGLYETRIIDEPGMVRTIALLQPEAQDGRIPDGLADCIMARATEIKRTMEAVY
jgi:LysR family transcriptional regulator, nitrogen assimilation regulatory protein